MRIPGNTDLILKSRYLRNNPTREENHLWYDFLRTYPVQFNRQRIIGNYIADFYCPKARLVIEIDGDTHHQVSDKCYDEERSLFFERYKIKVIRFTNKSIWNNFRNVCEKIDKCVNERIGQ